MKNSKIHLGLENSVLRDFLSISIVKNQEIVNKKIVTKYSPNSLEWSITDCENEIIYHTHRLELLKELHAITTLIKIQGWKEFDVSDETEKDLHYRFSMTFIGTQAEYDSFIKTIKK